MNTPLLHELVSTLILARHGEAVAAEGRPDTERELNDLGVKQAEALNTATQDFRITVVLSSPLKRAINTARIATNGSSLPIRPVAELSCLDDPNDPLMVMWTTLGNVPIRQYFDHELGEHLKTWGRTTLRAVIRELQDGGPDQKVLIGGHALLQNALLWAIAEQLENNMGTGWRLLYEMAETRLNEGEAFVVKFVGDRVCQIEHLKPMAH